MYSLWWLSSEGTTVQQLERPSTRIEGRGCTIDIQLAVLHELAELSEPLGGVDLRHVDSTARERSVESSGEERRRRGGYISCRCRVGAHKKARKKHEWPWTARYRACMHPATRKPYTAAADCLLRRARLALAPPGRTCKKQPCQGASPPTPPATDAASFARTAFLDTGAYSIFSDHASVLRQASSPLSDSLRQVDVICSATQANAYEAKL